MLPICRVSAAHGQNVVILTKSRMYGSIFAIVEQAVLQSGGTCGQVKLVVMKVRAALQALRRICQVQAQRDTYMQLMIGISEHGKPGMHRPLQADCAVPRKRFSPITVFYPGESSGMVPVKR